MYEILIVCIVTLALVSGVLGYRIYLHPISHVPGPPLAIATYLYEWYYDLYLNGQFTFRLEALHKRYGPIIRINPNDIHIDDPNYFDEVFNQTNGRAQKPPEVAEAFGPYPAVNISHSLIPTAI